MRLADGAYMCWAGAATASHRLRTRAIPVVRETRKCGRICLATPGTGLRVPLFSRIRIDEDRLHSRTRQLANQWKDEVRWRAVDAQRDDLTLGIELLPALRKLFA